MLRATCAALQEKQHAAYCALIARSIDWDLAQVSAELKDWRRQCWFVRKRAFYREPSLCLMFDLVIWLLKLGGHKSPGRVADPRAWIRTRKCYAIDQV